MSSRTPPRVTPQPNPDRRDMFNGAARDRRTSVAQEEASWNAFVTAAETAAGRATQHNADIEAGRKQGELMPREEVFRDIVDAFNNRRAAVRAELERARAANANNPQAYEAAAREILTRNQTAIRDELTQRHGSDAARAMNAITQQGNGPGMLQGLISNFYDSNNGGVQWGALAGGLGLGLVGFMLTKGAGFMVAAIATVIGLVVGTTAGARYIDGPPQPQPRANFRAPRTTGGGPQPQPGQEPGQDPSLDERQGNRTPADLGVTQEGRYVVTHAGVDNKTPTARYGEQAIGGTELS